MNGRVKRNRPNFEARKSKDRPVNYTTINHFVPIVKRNEDLYSFIAMTNCIVEKLSIYVSTMVNIKEFSLDLFFYRGDEFIKKTYEIKQGSNVFEKDNTVINAGEVVKLDIQKIDSVYKNVSGVTIGILLADKVGI